MKRANLGWTGGVPAAPDFGDHYYSQEDGLAESRAVFLRGCGLPGAWRDRKHFTVGELGFGSGLNFLALWDLWRRARPAGARLHFVSVEGFPMDAAEARRAHSAWPELADLSARLTGRWPPSDPGAHFRRVDDDGVFLTVFHAPAAEALSEMDLAADAWFLDGFAPSRNPQMWSPEIMRAVAQCSAPGARAATFTVAGAVRRALGEAGFTVEKKPGHGRKRERLEACLPGTPAPEPAPGRIAIIGGGVAGASLASALTARGAAPRIITEGPAASDPPRALLTPRLENADRPHARALTSAFHHAVSLYAALGYAPSGAVRTARDDREVARFTALTERWSGLSVDDERLFMHGAGVLDPQIILLGLAGGAAQIPGRAASIRRQAGIWRVMDASDAIIAEAETLILAAGAGAPAFEQCAPMDLELSAGQAGLHAFDGALDHPVTGPAYLAPAGEGRVMLGATHDHWESAAPPSPDPARQHDLLGKLAETAPGLAARVAPEPLALWSGVRCATKDRLPVAGALEAGLYILCGLGSRGYAHAPLLAEMIVAEICGDPAPIEKTGRDAFRPGRFEDRRRKREGA